MDVQGLVNWLACTLTLFQTANLTNIVILRLEMCDTAFTAQPMLRLLTVEGARLL